jgi:subtilisin family serine protease
VPSVRFFATVPAADSHRFYPLLSARRGPDAAVRGLLAQLPSAAIDADFAGARLRGLAGATPDFRLSGALAAATDDDAVAADAAVLEDTYVIRGKMDERDVERAGEGLEGGVRLWADPQIAVRKTCCFGDRPVGTDADVRRLLGLPALGAAGLDGNGVALAIVDEGINVAHLAAKGMNAKLDANRSTTKAGQPGPGHAPAYHGTMCAYDALLAAPRSTLLDIAVLSHPPNLPTLLSDAVVAFQGLLNLMLATPRPYASLVVSNSWGVLNAAWDYPAGNPLRYIDNPHHAFNILGRSLVRSGADVVFAAGNCGPSCPAATCHGLGAGLAINGANSHPDVLSVGAADVTGTLAGYSAQGPGALSSAKPDLLGYSHFLGSEALGHGVADEGTSAAAPVVAGVVAALRSKFPFDPALPKRQPRQVRDFLLTEANVANGRQPFAHDVGWGTITTHRFLDASITAAIA